MEVEVEYAEVEYVEVEHVEAEHRQNVLAASPVHAALSVHVTSSVHAASAPQRQLTHKQAAPRAPHYPPPNPP